VQVDVLAPLQELRIDGPEPVRPERAPARPQRESYPFRLDVRTCFGDLDTNRHVNNVALAGWYLDALAELHTGRGHRRAARRAGPGPAPGDFPPATMSA